jgi:hypothetical protein
MALIAGMSDVRVIVTVLVIAGCILTLYPKVFSPIIMSLLRTTSSDPPAQHKSPRSKFVVCQIQHLQEHYRANYFVYDKVKSDFASSSCSSSKWSRSRLHVFQRIQPALVHILML